MSALPVRITHVALSTLPVMAWPLKYSSQKTFVANCTDPHAASMDCGANPSDTKLAMLPSTKNTAPSASQRVLLEYQRWN